MYPYQSTSIRFNDINFEISTICLIFLSLIDSITKASPPIIIIFHIAVGVARPQALANLLLIIEYFTYQDSVNSDSFLPTKMYN